MVHKAQRVKGYAASAVAILVAGTVIGGVVFGCCWRPFALLLVRGGWLNIDMGYTIVYVVPNGFRGIFRIVESKRAHTEPRDCGAGVLEFTIPASGVASMADVTALLTWHAEVARFADGSALPVLGQDSVRDGQVALRPIGGVEGGGVEALVGTGEEYRDYLRSRRAWIRWEEPSAEVTRGANSERSNIKRG